MKLNYSPLQHPVDPVEVAHDAAPPRPERPLPVLVLPLHGHLAPAAWACVQAAAGCELGYVQTPGAALPGSLSRDVASLRERGLLAWPRHRRAVLTAASTRRSASPGALTRPPSGSAGMR